MGGKIFSLAAVLFLGLFLVLGFAPLAAADNGGSSAVDQYNAAKDKYQLHVDAYQQAKQDWLTAKNNWLKFKRANETPELIVRAKSFLNSGIDRAVSYLEVLDAKVEGLNTTDEEKASMASQIDASIAAFNALKPEVDAAQTKDEIEAVSKKINDQYKLLKPLVKRMTGLYLSARINLVLAKGDSLAAIAQDRIDVLKAGGINTAELEADLANFNQHLANAKAKYESAKQTFASINSPADADALFQRGHNYLLEVNQYLKKAYAELKDLRSKFGRVRLSGTGAVSASGNGLAVFSGNGTMTASTAQTGALFVSSNAIVTTDGTGSKEDLGNGTIKYQGFGSVTAAGPSDGSSFDFKLSGNGISLYVNGSGTIKLSGQGSYNTSTGKTGSFPASAVVSPQ